MKPAVKMFGIVIAVLIVVAIALPLLVNVNSFRPEIESRLGAALGRQVKVGNLGLSLLGGGVRANDLSISDDPKFSNSPFIKAKSLKVGVELIPLIFSKQLNVTELVIDQPEVTLLRNQAGIWNFSSVGSKEKKTTPAEKSEAFGLSVGKIELTDGKISLGSIPAKRKPTVYDKVEVTVRKLSAVNAFPVVASLRLPSGGSMKVDGKMGPINSNDASLSPLNAKLEINKLDLSQSALVDPELGVAGQADFDGTVDSDGRIAKTRGTLKGTNLKLVPKGARSGRPVQVQYTLEHNLSNESGRLSQGDISIGKATAKLTGTYETRGDKTSVHTRLVGTNMPVDELEAALPAVGVVLPPGSQLKGGTLSLELDSAGLLEKLVTTGMVKLNNTTLAGFDLGSKLAAISALSGKQTGNDTNIQNLSSDVRISPDGTRLDKMSLIIPALGNVTGNGVISPGGTLNFRMAASLTGGTVTGLTQMAGLGSKGASNIPFMIEGTTSSPKFVPDVQGIVGGQIQGILGSQTGGQGDNPLGGLSGLLGRKKKPQ